MTLDKPAVELDLEIIQRVFYAREAGDFFLNSVLSHDYGILVGRSTQFNRNWFRFL
jgi:hypothetical protein